MKQGPKAGRATCGGFRRNCGRSATAAFLAMSLAAAGCGREAPGGHWATAGAEAAEEEPPAPPAAPAAPAQAGDPALLARGLALYAKQCAACHGPQGLGDGPAAYLLFPKPRNFSRGNFRITSTLRGLPSDEDLLSTLRRGMPGSSMPPWGHLGEADLRALVAAVRHLAVEGDAAQRVLDSQEGGTPMTLEEARSGARASKAPGPPVVVPPPPASRAGMAERGATTFQEACAPCHDADGRGRRRMDLKDNEGNPIFARDFTRGVFKGRSDEESLALRVFRGIPGSPMPASDLPADKLWAVASYVRSLIPAEAEARNDRSQRTLSAKRVPGPLGTDPGAPVWKDVGTTFLPVAPLWWRNDRTEGVEFQSAHDGSRLAVRLRWDDATADDLVLSQNAFGDGAALQLSNEADPPFFGMGAADGAVNIWHWKAVWQRDAEKGTPSLQSTFPEMPADGAAARSGAPDDPVFTTAAASGNPVAQPTHGSVVEDLSAGGFGTLASRGPADQPVQGAAHRVKGGWEVVFLRPLGPGTAHDVALEPGATVSFCLAVWDGSAGDRNGQKSVTIWHRLGIEK